MNTLAIIPARGGSKGIRRKNLRVIHGVPLIARMIRISQGAELIDHTIVTTDDEDIATVSRRYDAEVIPRPVQLASDTASSESALLHVLGWLGKTSGYVPDLTVFLQCTSPLTRPSTIDGTIRALLDGDADCALSVTPFHYFLWREDDDGRATGINHDAATRALRQERTTQFIETGGVYVMRTKGFIAAQHRFFGKTVIYVCDEHALEIDEPEDFRIARVLCDKV